MDISVQRNSFGRQIDSCETEIVIPALSTDSMSPFPAVFIRAPHIARVGPGVEVLAEFEGRIVLARQQHCLAAAFHPEITNDDRIHRYFLEVVCAGR
jgi:5'-phosphate synthase pdxT subunit